MIVTEPAFNALMVVVPSSAVVISTMPSGLAVKVTSPLPFPDIIAVSSTLIAFTSVPFNVALRVTIWSPLLIFNVIFVDNEKIRELNREYRNIDKTTDVISFALEDYQDIHYDFRLLGDIYISIPKAEEQAKEYGHSFLREISFLTIHGFLHLLGYDHKKEQDEKIMFELQERILDSYGIKK